LALHFFVFLVKQQAPNLTVPQGWCFPRTVARFGERLFGQQLWCWGRDIQYPKSNLLMRYGFTRYRQRGSDGSTCYRFDTDKQHIALWGFGLWYGSREFGGIFLNRFNFVPQWGNFESLALGIHLPEDLPPLGRPRDQQQWQRAHRLCCKLMAWIASYECWVRREAGLDYRRQCVATWLRPLIAAERMPAGWRMMQRRCWDTDAVYWNEVVNGLTNTFRVKNVKQS